MTEQVPFNSFLFEPYIQFYLVLQGARQATLVVFEHEKAAKEEIMNLAQDFGLLWSTIDANQIVFYTTDIKIETDKDLGNVLGFYCNTNSDEYWNAELTRLGIGILINHPKMKSKVQIVSWFCADPTESQKEDIINYANMYAEKIENALKNLDIEFSASIKTEYWPNSTELVKFFEEKEIEKIIENEYIIDSIIFENGFIEGETQALFRKSIELAKNNDFSHLLHYMPLYALLARNYVLYDKLGEKKNAIEIAKIMDPFYANLDMSKDIVKENTRMFHSVDRKMQSQTRIEKEKILLQIIVLAKNNDLPALKTIFRENQEYYIAAIQPLMREVKKKPIKNLIIAANNETVNGYTFIEAAENRDFDMISWLFDNKFIVPKIYIDEILEDFREDSSMKKIVKLIESKQEN